MHARDVLDIRQRLVDNAISLQECAEMVKRLEVYPDEVRELERIYQRLMDVFTEIKWEQAE